MKAKTPFPARNGQTLRLWRSIDAICQGPVLPLMPVYSMKGFKRLVIGWMPDKLCRQIECEVMMFGNFEIRTTQILENSNLMRGGRKATRWTAENSEIQIFHNPGEGAIDIRTSMPSKGGGTTEITIKIGRNDFKYILYAMLIASPKLFIEQYVKFALEIKKMICAKSFVEKDYSGKLRIENLYDDLTENVSDNIKSNVILFEALSLATKNSTPAKSV